MKILNLFSGMGCDIMAHSRTNLPPITKVYHADIDKYAMAVDRFLHPQVIQLGDVTKIKGSDLGHIDLLLGGSPCQGFSFSGKQLAFDDPRSQLFFQFVRILKELREINPKIHFLLENVKMKKEFRDVITQYLGTHPIELDSALDSAQSRKRLYWASWGIMPQIDKGVVLSDILEDFGQADLVGKQGKVLLKENIEKASCFLARDYKGFGNQGQTVVRCIEVGHAEEIKGHDVIRRVYSPNGKSPTLNTMGGGNREPKVAIGQIVGRRINPKTKKRDDYNKDIKPRQRLEIRADKKSGALTTVQKDNVVVNEDIRWRALTPIECERLQTVEDNATLYGIDENGKQITISKTQRYKMLGNGWCVDTIAHILSYLEGRI